MLLKLLQTLRAAKLQVTPLEVAEALLLARFLPASQPAAELPVPAIPPPATEADKQTAKEQKPEQTQEPDHTSQEPDRSPLQPGDAVLPQPTTTGTGTVAAVPFRSPQARALPAAQKIGGALRPLRRRHFSAQRVVMDEEATVQQIADGGPKIIVWQPARERWLSVELVLDESLSMHIWRPTLREFRQLLERHGAFRNVRTWQLKTDEKDAQLWQVMAKEQRVARPQQLLSPAGRQLVIVVSDCTAQAWYHGSAYQMLTQWARQTPTVLTQVLPRSLWLGTSMTEDDVTMRANQPGLPNAKLHVQPDVYADWLKTGAPLPVITLDEWSIAPWAKMVAGSGQSLASGLVLPDMTEAIAQDDPLPAPTRPAPANAAARMQNFMGTASPLARQLARYLAVAPLSLPVLQLVQQAMLPQSRQSHLAEIFRSDLMNLPAPTTVLTEETIFDFYEGVRDELLRDLTRHETLFVLDKVADFIFERSGQARGFGALVAVPGSKAPPSDAVNVDPLALSFARIGARTLRKIGLRSEQATQWENFVQRHSSGEQALPTVRDVVIETEIAPPTIVPLASIQPGSSPDDPWKGVFGGRSEANQRQLRATVSPRAGVNLFRIKLSVRSTSRQHPLRRNVTFFLHPSFGERRTVAVNKKGVAEITLEGWGAFTVGVWADDGATLLELDLAELPKAPQAFREVPPFAQPPILSQPHRYKFACYISYAGGDRETRSFESRFYEALSQELEMLTDKPIFFDREMLVGGERWEQTITAALYQSACYLVLCTPNLFQSPFHLRELEAIRRLAAHRQKVLGRKVGLILPVILFPPEIMPTFLQKMHGVDLSRENFPTKDWFNHPNSRRTIQQIVKTIFDWCQEVGHRPDLFADLQNFQLPSADDIPIDDYKRASLPSLNQPPSEEAAHLMQQAREELNRGQYEEASFKLEQALAIYRELQDQNGETLTLVDLGKSYYLSNDFQQALRCYTEALELARETKIRNLAGVILDKLGLVYVAQGELKLALQSYRESLAIFRHLGDKTGEAGVLGNLGLFHLRMADEVHPDNAREAIEPFERQLQLARDTDDKQLVGLALLNLGTAYDKLGETKRAIEYYHQAMPTFAELKQYGMQADALFALSRALQRDGQRADALRYGQHALTLYEQLKSARAEEMKLFIGELSHQTLPPVGDNANPVSHSVFVFETVTLDRRGKESQREHRTARQFSDELAPGIQLEMVAIPGGIFQMGTADKDIAAVKKEYERYLGGSTNWVDSETPQHSVTVAPFYLGKFTITQEQWRVIAAETSLKVARDLDPEPAHFKNKPDSARRPVELVSWEDAQEFCARLAKKTGRAYRLPSEAEWEYACRAGTTTPFAFGETITPEIVNYDGSRPYADAPKGKKRSETIPVGSLGVANAWGLFDMHGNVWEWCEDVWHDNYDRAPEDGSAWTTGGNSNRRILRGGGWGLYGSNGRSAHRLDLAPGARDGNIGFRVVVAARTRSPLPSESEAERSA